MPELPDVEIFKQYLDATSLHQEIEDVDVRNRKILEDTSVQELEKGLNGRRLESTRRHGKYLFAQLDDDNWLMLHFGMTGRLKYFKADEFDFAAFKEVLNGRRAMVKSVLMDQQTLAGVGNVYSDEILFQARVHPKKKVNELDEETLRDIFEAIKDVLQTAIDHKADPEQFPDSFLTPQRHEEGKCPNCGGKVERIKVSGRSGYYCPECQT